MEEEPITAFWDPLPQYKTVPEITCHYETLTMEKPFGYGRCYFMYTRHPHR